MLGLCHVGMLGNRIRARDEAPAMKRPGAQGVQTVLPVVFATPPTQGVQFK